MFSLGRPFYRSTLYIMLSLVNDGLIPNFQAEVVCIWGSANTTGKSMHSNNLYPLMGNIIGQVGLFSLGVAAQEKENFKLRLKISKCHILLWQLLTWLQPHPIHDYYYHQGDHLVPLPPLYHHIHQVSSLTYNIRDRTWTLASHTHTHIDSLFHLILSATILYSWFFALSPCFSFR